MLNCYFKVIGKTQFTVFTNYNAKRAKLEVEGEKPSLNYMKDPCKVVIQQELVQTHDQEKIKLQTCT